MIAVSHRNGFKVRTQCQVGYWSFDSIDLGENMTEQQRCNNTCIEERNKRSWNCGWAGWPQDDPANMCYGNNNGKELDSCMSTCWSPQEMNTYRPQAGKPYNSIYGDECFDWFLKRANAGMAYGENRAEWDRCMTTFK